MFRTWTKVVLDETAILRREGSPAFTQSTYSAKVLIPNVGDTAKAMEKLPTFVSGVRSVVGSKGKSLLFSRDTRVVDDSSASSDPSGVPFLTISPGTAPDDPVRLSTLTRRL